MYQSKTLLIISTHWENVMKVMGESERGEKVELLAGVHHSEPKLDLSSAFSVTEEIVWKRNMKQEMIGPRGRGSHWT